MDGNILLCSSYFEEAPEPRDTASKNITTARVNLRLAFTLIFTGKHAHKQQPTILHGISLNGPKQILYNQVTAVCLRHYTKK